MKTNINKKIGKQLKERREELLMTQEELAQELNCHRNNISDIERGVRGISLETLQRYCIALDLKIFLKKL